MANRQYPHSPGFLADRAARDLCVRLHSGTAAMREAWRAERYMRANPGEQEPFYGRSPEGAEIHRRDLSRVGLSMFEARVDRSTVRNVWAARIAQACTMPFRGGIGFDGWPSALEHRLGNVDKSGRTARQYWASSFNLAMHHGIHWTLVDLPSGPPASSLDEARQRGQTPYWVPVMADDFDPLAIGEFDGRTALTAAAVYMSTTSRIAGATPVDSEVVERHWIRTFRVARRSELAGPVDDSLLPATIGNRESLWFWDDPVDKDRLLAVDKDGKRIPGGPWRPVVPMDGSPLVHVPAVPHYGGYTAAFRGLSRFAEAAWDQALLSAKISERDDLARRIARLRVGLIGVDPTQPPMLGDVIELAGAHAKDIKLLETTGAALRSLAEDISDLRGQIEEACLAVQRREDGSLTATEIRADDLRATSPLELDAHASRASLDTLLRLTCRMMGAPAADSATVNWDTDMTASVSDAAMERATRLAMSGYLTLETLYGMAQTRGELPEDLDILAEAATVRQQLRERDSALFDADALSVNRSL